ncbi:PQQ-binding-like beta-propeller repeat protein [Dermatophilaceae bacterium Soc4.6]
MATGTLDSTSASPIVPSTVSPAVRAVTDWPQFQGNSGHTGVAGPDATLTPSALKSMKPVWYQSVDAPSEYDAPVVADGMVYSATRGGVVAFRVTDGALVWQAHLTDPISNQDAYSVTTPAVNKGVVVVAGFAYIGRRPHGLVFGVDALTGAVKWRRALPHPVFTAPTVVHDAALVMAFGGPLFKLRLGTGTLLWTADVAAGTEVAGSSAPVVDGDRVVVAVPAGPLGGVAHLTAVDLHTGANVWAVPLCSGPSEGEDKPLVARNGVIYTGCFNGDFRAVKARTGVTLWQTNIAPTLGYWPFVVTPTRLIAQTPRVTALDRATGAVAWRDPPSTPVMYDVAPVVVGDTAIIADATGLTLRSVVDGSGLGRLPLGDFPGHRAVAEGHILVAVPSASSVSRTLIAFAPAR